MQLKCVAELAARMAKAKAAERLAFDTPETIADYFMEDLRYAEQEQLHVLFLNTRNKLLKEKLMFQGTVNASLVSPREIFMEALECRQCAWCWYTIIPAAMRLQAPRISG